MKEEQEKRTVGVLVDMSTSMQSQTDASSRLNQTLRTLHEISSYVVHRVPTADVFLGAYGLKNDGMQCADIVALAQKIRRERDSSPSPEYFSGNPYKDLIELLRRNGAPSIRKFASRHKLIQMGLGKEEVEDALKHFICDEYAMLDFIRRLPRHCRQPANDTIEDLIPYLFIVFVISAVLVGPAALVSFLPLQFLVVSEGEWTRMTHQDLVLSGIEKGIQELRREISLEVRARSCKTVARVIEKFVDGEGSESALALSDFKEHLDGKASMSDALARATRAFGTNTHNGLLVVVSFGDSHDGDQALPVESLHKAGITVVSCLVSDGGRENPKTLFDSSRVLVNMDDQTSQKMAMLASNLAVESLPIVTLSCLGWSVPPSRECKLFVQANKPEEIQDLFMSVLHLSQNYDALIDMVGKSDIDAYIRSDVDGYSASHQNGRTCYANAVAAVFHMAMCRIVGRKGGYPSFASIRDELIVKYGRDVSAITEVLRENAPLYRLRYSVISEERRAREAVIRRRPVIATFSLQSWQWDRFSQFFRDNPEGILTREDLMVPGAPAYGMGDGGHAVVLVGCSPNHLRFMNSWGHGFADGGFFRVADAKVLDMKFLDVHWTLTDLTKSEKAALRDSADERVVRRQTVAGAAPLVEQLFDCPVCGVRKPVSAFASTALSAQCPTSSADFDPSAKGLDFARFVYASKSL